ncbi:MAG: winged helix-turn-helix domain-containing protein [Nitriliruptoraceae bacterium]
MPERAPEILVVEDAPEIVAYLVPVLRGEGFAVTAVSNGAAAVEAAERLRPDVVLLDLGLPDMDGLDVGRAVRAFGDTYVIIVSAKDTEVDKVVGLSVCGDDYVTKPFSALELVARIRAVLRRPRQGAAAAATEIRRFGELRLDVAARLVHVGDREVELTRTEFDLLTLLTSRPRMVFSRRELLRNVWGDPWSDDDHLLHVHMSNLRRKLSDAGAAPSVETVRGVGYRLARSLVEAEAPVPVSS